MRGLEIATLAETEVDGHSLTRLVSDGAMTGDILENGECTEHWHGASAVVIGPGPEKIGTSWTTVLCDPSRSLLLHECRDLCREIISREKTIGIGLMVFNVSL